MDVANDMVARPSKNKNDIPNSGVTLLNTWVLAIVRMLAAQGLAARELLRYAKIDPAVLQEVGARVPAENVQKLWLIASKLSGREDIGLEMAKHLGNKTTYAFEIALQSAQTPRDALLACQQFRKVISTSGTFDIEETEDEFILTRSLADDEFRPCGAAQDAVIAVSFALFKEAFSHIDGIFKSVELIRPEPHDPSPYYDFFPCPVSFGHDTMRCRFDLAAMNQDLYTGMAIPARLADELIDQHDLHIDKDDIEYRARQAIIEGLKTGLVNRKIVAEDLAMSERNLNHRLATKNLSFKDLFDQERKNQAITLLTEGQKNITAIAYTLGFRDASSFSRAFKRWTGEKPTNIQRSSGCKH